MTNRAVRALVLDMRELAQDADTACQYQGFSDPAFREALIVEIAARNVGEPSDHLTSLFHEVLYELGIPR